MADAFGMKDVDGIFDLFGAAGFPSVGKKVKGFKMRADNFLWARDAYVEA